MTPPLFSLVLHQNKVCQVRDRTRNKATGKVTLWLCESTRSGYTNEDAPIPTPLEEVAPAPIPTEAEIEAYLAQELADCLRMCPSYQEVLASTDDFNPTQKAAAWKLLSAEEKSRIHKLKEAAA